MPPKRRIELSDDDDSDHDVVVVNSGPRSRPSRDARSSSIASVPRKAASKAPASSSTTASARAGPSRSSPAKRRSGPIPEAVFYGTSSKNARSSSVHSRSARRSTAASAEPPLFLTMSDLDPVEEAEGSNTDVSPPPGRPTPIEYDYVDDDGPAASKAGPSRGRPYVDIVFRPLEELREYTYADDSIPRPSLASRARLLDAQRTRPRSPKRIQAPRASKPMAPEVYVVDDDDDDEFRSPTVLEYEDEGEDELESEDEDEFAAVRVQPMRTRKTAREKSSSPEMVSTRAQARAQQQQPQRKRRRSSSRSSNASYRPNGGVVQEWSEGESELDEIAEWSDYSSSRSPVKSARATPRVLTRHREYCEKCQFGPADELLAKALKKKRKPGRKKRKDEDVISEEEEARSKEGWLECERCVTSYHWGCLTADMQRDVLIDHRTKFPNEPRRTSIAIDEVALFTCARCKEYPVCFVCKEEHIKDDKSAELDKEKSKSKSPEKTPNKQANGSQAEPIAIDSDAESADPLDLLRSDRSSSPEEDYRRRKGKGKAKGKLVKQKIATPLLFRCIRCKQAVHYEHLPNPFTGDEDYTLPALAAEYQSNLQGTSWYCHCCRDWRWLVDKVIAWRPLPENAVEPDREPGELPRYKDRLPRAYLIKFRDRSFRHLAWVPHEWLQVVAHKKLRNFLEKGPQLDLVTDETLAARGDQMIAPTIMDVLDDREEQHSRHIGELAELEAKWEGHGPPPDELAEESIPTDWSTVDRLLDVYLLPPKNRKKKSSQVARNRVVSSESDDSDPELEDGIQPPEPYMVEINRWENMADRKLTADDVDEIAPQVTWFFAKWQDLQYDQSCFDTPPSPDDEIRYPAFKRALGRYLTSRRTLIPVLSARDCNARDRRAADLANEDPPKEQPECITGGELMPFQLEGFQWLLYKHWSREGCILADDMGLGKTIQVCSFLGYLCSEEHMTYPHLVVVPNSTITNWVREFEKWVPHVRVVPYYGEAASRKVISQYELYHMGKQNKAEGLRAHVVLSTYDTVTGSEFRLFNNIPRWETVIVDEGQRLKSDSSLMFNKLKKLNAVHRVLLTGTPLNNNLRELFNLLNFIDPENFTDLQALEERFEALNESLVLELHNMLKPYILRRIKSQVLKLPPKVEIIVPTSMTPAQKRLTKIVLASSAEVLGNIRKKRQAAKKRKVVEAQAVAEAAEAAEVDGLIRSGGPSGAASPDKGGEDKGKGKAKAVEIVLPDEVIEVDGSPGPSKAQANGHGDATESVAAKRAEKEREDTEAESLVDEGLGEAAAESPALRAAADELTLD